MLIQVKSQSTYSTDMEDASKSSYASAIVTHNGVSWTLQQALIGTSGGFDRFNGSKAWRIRYRTSGNQGEISMNQDVNGIDSISFLYAQYATDDSPVLRVEYSTNSGSTWTQAGSDITTKGVTTLTKWSHYLNISGPVRIRIRSMSGGTNRRANIDDLAFTLAASVTPVSASITAQTNVLCNGDSTGALTVTASDGTTPYTYSWSNGDATASISTLKAGTYTVTVTDAGGATTTAQISITEPLPIVVTINSVTNVDCYGASTGAMTSSVTGGITPYTYHWSSGETSSFITNKPAGSYTVYVQDTNGCGDAPPP